MARWATVVGAVVLAIAIGMVGVTAYTIVEIVKDPSGRLSALQNHINVTSTGPTASFSWSSQGYRVTFTDTSTDNGSAIASWLWDFGDGTGFAGSSPPPHTYGASCPQCTEQVTLGVTDRAGNHAVATAEVMVQRFGGSNGVAQSPSVAQLVPQLGGALSELPGILELLFLMLLAAFSAGKAAWNLLGREPETVQVPVRPREPTAG